MQLTKPTTMRLLAASVAVAFAWLSPGQPAVGKGPASMSLAAEAISASGLDKSLAEVSKTIGGDTLTELQEQAPAAKDAKFVAAWAKATEAAYAKSKLSAAVAMQLSASLSDAELTEIVAYYRDGLGKRFIDADKATDSDDAAMRMMAQAAELKQHLTANPQRTADYERLVKGFKLVELALPVMQATLLATEVGRDALAEGGARQPLDALQKKADAQMPLVKGMLEGATMLTVAFGYKSLADADIKGHADHIARPVPAKFIAAIEASLPQDLSAATKSFHTTLNGELGKK